MEMEWIILQWIIDNWKEKRKKLDEMNENLRKRIWWNQPPTNNPTNPTTNPTSNPTTNPT